MIHQQTKTGRRDSVVTGGASGIARSICLRLAEEGLVGVLDRDLTGAQETVRLIEAAGGNAIALQADVSNLNEVNHAFTTFAAAEALLT